MTGYAKPRVVASRCLGSDTCRYDGATISNEFLKALEPNVRLVKMCPEVEIGLGERLTFARERAAREPVRRALTQRA